MKELERCKYCDFRVTYCPLIIEDVLDFDDGERKYSTSKERKVKVPGCEYDDEATAFELMDECPMTEQEVSELEAEINN